MKTYLLVGDMHVPFHCVKATAFVSRLIRKLNVDGLVQMGDAVDAFQISSYIKDPKKRNRLSEDIKVFDRILDSWSRDLKCGAFVHLLEGNHERRLSKYIATNCRDIDELVPDWPKLLRIKERNEKTNKKWYWHSYDNWASCKIGDTTLMHGFYYNQHVAMTLLQKYKTNCITGHVHRVQYVTDGKHYAATIGHISDEKKTAHNPVPTGWQQAVALLNVDKTGRTTLEIIPIQEGRGVVRGEII